MMPGFWTPEEPTNTRAWFGSTEIYTLPDKYTNTRVVSSTALSTRGR